LAGALAEEDLARLFVRRHVVAPPAGDVERKTALHSRTSEDGVDSG